jgi:hypothetical protein
MKLIDQLREAFRGHFGILVENRPAPLPDVTQVEAAVAIGCIFDADTVRQKLQHELDMRGGPRISTNDANLDRDRSSKLGRTIDDWLR